MTDTNTTLHHTTQCTGHAFFDLGSCLAASARKMELLLSRKIRKNEASCSRDFGDSFSLQTLSDQAGNFKQDYNYN